MVECPIVFVESGHCVLMVSEVQDILSYHFCFHCASLLLCQLGLNLLGTLYYESCLSRHLSVGVLIHANKHHIKLNVSIVGSWHCH